MRHGVFIEYGITCTCAYAYSMGNLLHLHLAIMSESHVMKLIASHIHSISPKVTSHRNFWLQKWWTQNIAKKRVVTSTHLFFLCLAFGVAMGYGWHECACASVCVSDWSPLSIHITVSNLHLLYYFPKIYIYTYSWEQCYIYIWIGRISIQNVSCHLHVTLFAVTCHFYFASTLCKILRLHTCLYASLSSSFSLFAVFVCQSTFLISYQKCFYDVVVAIFFHLTHWKHLDYGNGIVSVQRASFEFLCIQIERAYTKEMFA